MNTGYAVTVLILILLNVVSCERAGILRPFQEGKPEVILVDGAGQPMNESFAYDKETFEEDGIAYTQASQTWAYIMLITFGILCIIFPPYRWLLYAMLIFVMIIVWNRDD